MIAKIMNLSKKKVGRQSYSDKMKNQYHSKNKFIGILQEKDIYRDNKKKASF